MIIYSGSLSFNKFFHADLFSGELVPISESLFDTLVIHRRDFYDMEYDPCNINAQNFYIDGQLVARRERSCR